MNNSSFQFLKSSYENLIGQSLLHKNFENYKGYLLISDQYKKDFSDF